MSSPWSHPKPSQNGTSVYMENFTSVYIQFKHQGVLKEQDHLSEQAL